MIYGYARVSTDSQSVAAQVGTLTAAGAEKVFRQVASGAETDRRELRHVLNQLDAGGVKMGRPFKLTPHQQREAIRGRDSGAETLADIGRSYNVSGSTISRLAI